MSNITRGIATSGPGSGTVTSITAGTGLTATPNPIVGAGTIALDTTALTTTNGTVYWNGTRLASTTTGTAGFVLTSNGASAPTYQALPASGVTGPGSSTNRAIATWNGTTGAALFNNSSAVIDSTGRMTNTAQPAFLGYLSTSTANNVTGNGTTYTIVFDSERYDQGANFNTATGIFTAPITGKYLLSTCVFCANVGAQTTIQCVIVTTAQSYEGVYQNPSTTMAAGGFLGVNNTVLADMTAGDTARVNVIVSGGTQTVGVLGAAGGTYTRFGGYLAC